MISQRIRIGDTASLQRKVTEAEVVQMAEISGDYNPIHLDKEYARTSQFGARIAHGLFCQAMISKLLGNDLPGSGTIIITEEVKFLRPVYLDDTITAQVSVKSIDPETGKAILSVMCRNQKDKPVLTGSILVLVPQE